MHHAFGIAFVIAAIAFAFGKRAAQICVGGVLIICLVACAYVAWLVVSGAI